MRLKYYFNLTCLLLFLTIISGVIFAQQGFIQSYCFEESNSLAFHDILLDNDTLVLYGRVRNLQTGAVGLYFSKMDTLGNILSETTHFDGLGDHYFFELDAKLVKCISGGYVIVGKLFFRNYPIIIKLKQDGSLDFVKEYPDDSVDNIHHWRIVETATGFISVGAKQQVSDGAWDAFVMGIDFHGNKLWEIPYGEPNVWDRYRNITYFSEQEIIISGSTSNDAYLGQSLANLWSINKFFCINSIGEIQWEWEDQVDQIPNSVGFIDLYHANSQNWVSLGINSILSEESDEYHFFQPELIFRNSDFEKILVVPILEHTSSTNQVLDLTQAENDNWIVTGRYVVLTSEQPEIGYDAGLIAKISSEGELLWTRTDTLFADQEWRVDHYLTGTAILPSGSIISCGMVNDDRILPGKSYAWLVKLDKNGCLQPGCNPSTSSTRLLDGAEYEVFPNPAANLLTVNGPGSFDLELIDTFGRILQSKNNQTENSSLDLGNYPLGTYYLRIKTGQRFALRKISKQ